MPQQTPLAEPIVHKPFKLMSPAPHLCQECAVAHMSSQPHNRDSLFYGVYFQRKHGRRPTWADAMAHCTEATKAAWVRELKLRGVEIA